MACNEKENSKTDVSSNTNLGRGAEVVVANRIYGDDTSGRLNTATISHDPGSTRINGTNFKAAEVNVGDVAKLTGVMAIGVTISAYLPVLFIPTIILSGLIIKSKGDAIQKSKAENPYSQELKDNILNRMETVFQHAQSDYDALNRRIDAVETKINDGAPNAESLKVELDSLKIERSELQETLVEMDHTIRDTFDTSVNTEVPGMLAFKVFNDYQPGAFSSINGMEGLVTHIAEIESHHDSFSSINDMYNLDIRNAGETQFISDMVDIFGGNKDINLRDALSPVASRGNIGNTNLDAVKTDLNNGSLTVISSDSPDATNLTPEVIDAITDLNSRYEHALSVIERNSDKVEAKRAENSLKNSGVDDDELTKSGRLQQEEDIRTAIDNTNSAI